jgi:hypothetical protein
MELTIPAYAKTISDTLKSRPWRTAPVAAPVAAPTPRPAKPAVAPSPRAAQPAPRPLGRLFRGSAPSTFHRCLAVHMHYAQRASALD